MFGKYVAKKAGLSFWIWLAGCFGAIFGGADSAGSAELAGKIADAQGQPIADVQVWVVDMGRGIERSARTDPAGQYHIRLLPGGQFLWRTFKPGCRCEHGQLALEPNQTLAHDLVLQPAQEYRLENDHLLLAIDENGAVRRLCNKQIHPEGNYLSGCPEIAKSGY